LNRASAPCSGGFQQCWNDLQDIWRNNAQRMNCVVMNSVMHHIAFGCYPDHGISKALQDLLLLVEQAVLGEGYAFEVWMESGVIRRELDFIREIATPESALGCCGSMWYGKYIYSRTFSQVRLKEREIDSVFEGICWADISMFGSASQARENVVAFEGAIQRLLPSAKCWSKIQWSDEAWILQEIHREHGIDFTQDYPAFDALIDVFVLALSGSSYDRSLMLLDAFPETMAACLWPQDPQKELERFFIRVCKRTRRQMRANPNTYGAFRTSILTNSWVWNYYSSGSVAEPKPVKTEKFNIMLGV